MIVISPNHNEGRKELVLIISSPILHLHSQAYEGTFVSYIFRKFCIGKLFFDDGHSGHII